MLTALVILAAPRDTERKLIGAPAVPGRTMVTASLYVPAATVTVSPAPTSAAARLIVRKGNAADLPVLLSLPLFATK